MTVTKNGFKQTKTHRSGRHSHNQLGLVRGQFGSVPEDQWLAFLQESGFDGFEEASWELALGRCSNDAGADEYARERVTKAKAHGLEIFSVAAHLQGQALGDEPTAKTLQFVGGEAVEAYKAWRKAGNTPPREDPYFIPPDVAALVRKQALEAMQACARYAHYLGKAQDRIVPVSGFTGSPAGCWNHWFLFPPLPTGIGGYAIPDVRQTSLELLVERFAPFLDLCKQLDVPFGLECHPSERAMGDLESADDYLTTMIKAGYEGIAGFNTDWSHLEWQGVSGVQFVREFGPHIFCAHVKGVKVEREHTRGGRLGGHRDMGHPTNGWQFVTAGTARDANCLEEFFITLDEAGFDGAVSIEWEDNKAQQLAGAKAALVNCQRANLPPSRMAHDATLKAAK